MARGAYRGDRKAELAGLTARRKAAGLSIEELAVRAGLGARTVRRAERDGLAFRRTVTALAAALREVEREAKTAAALFPEDGDA